MAELAKKPLSVLLCVTGSSQSPPAGLLQHELKKELVGPVPYRGRFSHLDLGDEVILPTLKETDSD